MAAYFLHRLRGWRSRRYMRLSTSRDRYLSVYLYQVKVIPGTFTLDEPIEDWARRVKQDDPDSPMLYFVLENLVPSSYYELQVRAMNNAGWSDPNKPFIFSTTEGRLRSHFFDNIDMFLACPCVRLYRDWLRIPFDAKLRRLDNTS